MRRLHLTPATVISLVALFFAVGGSAGYAAQQLINGDRITPHSITLKQINQKTAQALAGKQGPQGPQGNPGSSAAVIGVTGTASSLGEDIVTTQVSIPSGEESSGTVSCPAGQVATGGGGGYGQGSAGTTNGVNNFYLEGSSPVISSSTHRATGWEVGGYNTLPSTYSFPIYVICINQ